MIQAPSIERDDDVSRQQSQRPSSMSSEIVSPTEISGPGKSAPMSEYTDHQTSISDRDQDNICYA